MTKIEKQYQKPVIPFVFLILLGIIFWQVKPNPPIANNSQNGGFISLKKTKDNTKEKENGKTDESPKIISIDIYLDSTRLNKLNLRRNIQKLASLGLLNPLNKEKDDNNKIPFKPLLKITAQGPLNIFVKGEKSFSTVSLHVPKGIHEANIYPNFNKEFLAQGNNQDREDIKIYQEKMRGPKRLVETINAQWSGPQDLFLFHKNLIDIAALTGKRNTSMKPEKSPQQWLEQMAQKIKSLELRYETELAYSEPQNKGWQKVRSIDQMKSDGKANCIDMSTWVGKEALKAGYSSFLIANSGHALIAISLPDQDPKDAQMFETTDFLKPPLKKPKSPSEKPREYLPNEPIEYPVREPPRKKENKEMFLIDLDYWAQFYQ